MPVGAEAVAILSNRVSQINVQTRFIIDKNTWPPDQVKTFTPLLLIHYQGHRTPEQVRAMAELTCTGDIGKVASITDNQSAIKFHPKLDSCEKFELLDNSMATKEIQEILAPLEKSEESFILIEGAPGIGKSVLLKEIAYRWGKNELLQKFELVLLVCLRDPSLQQVKSVSDLLRLSCIGDENATELVRACSRYLFANGGKTLTLLLDGYDEYPVHLQENSLLTNILQRKVLPLCGLVVSSRPHASEHLRQQANVKVNILGFTETERVHYITQAFPNQLQKITELTQYLHQRPSINSICFIPFNMVILLYLYKLGIPLPKNSAELYHHFICLTVSRYLFKIDNPLTHNITDLTNLPQPYNRIIQQLSKLSLDALSINKLVFTFEEIKAACPGIETIPGAINGFGLLQAVQHFGLYTKTMTLNFIHFTIQEYLAAHYISHLPPNEELKVIKLKFWSDIHLNMFLMYVSLTKGQRPSFKKFLSDENEAITISQKFLKDRLKSLRLYHCFNRVDDHVMCETITQAHVSNGKVINFMDVRLTAGDVESLSLFLISSFNKEWEGFYLQNCYIQDVGLKILHHTLCCSSSITISRMQLGRNGLTTQSSSLISELAVKCKVKELWISGNQSVGEDQQLYSMLTDPSNVLETLNMYDTKLSPCATITLFTAVKDSNKLKNLIIAYNGITDDACDAITTALETNSFLVKLSMHNNPLSSEAIINIVRCLEVNNTLQLLELPVCPQGVKENIISLQEVVNKKRKIRGYQVKLEIKFSAVL